MAEKGHSMNYEQNTFSGLDNVCLFGEISIFQA